MSFSIPHSLFSSAATDRPTDRDVVSASADLLFYSCLFSILSTSSSSSFSFSRLAGRLLDRSEVPLPWLSQALEDLAELPNSLRGPEKVIR